VTKRIPKHKQKKRGRPDKFETNVDLKQVETLAQLGLTEAEICSVVGVSVASLNTYKKKHPELLESLRRGKVVADSKVVASLYKRATGIEYTETTRRTRRMPNANGTFTMVVVSEDTTTKFIAPDPTSCFFWLQNRKPDRWKRTNSMAGVGDLSEEQTNALRGIADTLMEERI
jgi:hypothetical protein